MNHRNIILLSSLLFLIGCSQKQEINVDTKPKYQVPKQTIQKPIIQNKGALYTRRGPSLFADKKDLQIGDIIRVSITETVSNKSTANRTSAQSTSSDKSKGMTFAGTSFGKKLNTGLGLGYQGSSTSSFKGDMSDKLAESFETTIAAIVTQRYQNGNYLIKGEKEVLINNQKQTMIFTGVIRPYDIDTDNMILSENIANLKIRYEQDGELIDNLDKPWGTKILDTIWPF